MLVCVLVDTVSVFEISLNTLSLASLVKISRSLVLRPDNCLFIFSLILFLKDWPHVTQRHTADTNKTARLEREKKCCSISDPAFDLNNQICEF